MNRTSVLVVAGMTLAVGLAAVLASAEVICEDTGQCVRWEKDTDGKRQCVEYKQKCFDTDKKEKEKKCIRYCKDEHGERFCCEYEKSSGMDDDALTPAILPTDGPSCEPEPVSTKAECLAKLAGEQCPGSCNSCGASKYTDCCLTESAKGGKSWGLCEKVNCTCPSACNKP